MRNVMCFLLWVVIFSLIPADAESRSKGKEITFQSIDGLEITANLYAPHEDRSTPFIVLFHQAGWSRGEYIKIAPRLNQMGFNCMAVDQRSGGRVNGVENETAKRAAEEGKGITYLDAQPDLVAALRYVRANHAEGKLIGWGSSYSSALVLQIAGDNPKLMDGVLSFSPGEYFEDLGRSKEWIGASASKIEVPVFITSARQEEGQWKKIYDGIPSKTKTFYIPLTAGNHGSRALWKEFEDNAGYWTAVTAFLDPFLSRGELQR